MNQAGRIPFGLIYGGIAIAALVFSRIVPLSGLFPPCSFKSLFGFPCPACGSGRTLGELSAGHFFEAFMMNPLFSLVIIGATIAFFLNGVTITAGISRPFVRFDSKFATKLKITSIVLFSLNWIFLIVIKR